MLFWVGENAAFYFSFPQFCRTSKQASKEEDEEEGNCDDEYELNVK